MTIKEYLIPRYVHTNPYPASDHFCHVGEIFEWDESKDCYVNILSGRSLYKTAVENFPLNFRKLGWWEERDELPVYIRLNQTMVVKVAKHGCPNKDEFQAHDTKYCYPYSIADPATKGEYKNPTKGQKLI